MATPPPSPKAGPAEPGTTVTVSLEDYMHMRKAVIENIDDAYGRGLVTGLWSGLVAGFFVGAVSAVVFLTSAGNMRALGR